MDLGDQLALATVLALSSDRCPGGSRGCELDAALPSQPSPRRPVQHHL